MTAGGEVRELEPAELASRLARGEEVDVIDVREGWEWKLARIAGARHIPLSQFAREVDSLDPDRELVLYCHHGARSLAAAHFLEQRGFARVWNLAGGIDRYACECAPDLPRY